MTTAEAPALSYSSVPGRWVLAGGLLAAITIVNPRRTPRPAGAPAPEECMYCGLEAPPLTTSVSRAPDT
jgi:hypothetical protein